MLIFNKKEFKDQMVIHGLTQDDLVEILYAQYDIDLTRGTLSKTINGYLRWKLELALAISQILEVDINELYRVKK